MFFPDFKRMLRQSFMSMLMEQYGIGSVGNPESYYNMPIANQIDLGQGTTVMPYVVNEMANLRVVTKLDYNSVERPGDNSFGYVIFSFSLLCFLIPIVAFNFRSTCDK